jgi:putative tricarboxylic transport membrane protein
MYKSDKIASMILVTFFTLTYYLAHSFPPRVARYPKGLAVIGIAMAILLFLNSYIKEKRKSVQSTDSKKKISKEQVFNIAATGIGSILYIILIPVLGYVVSTIVFMFGLMWVLSPKKKLLYAIVTTISILLLYGVFGLLLRVWLPRGFLL